MPIYYSLLLYAEVCVPRYMVTSLFIDAVYVSLGIFFMCVGMNFIYRKSDTVFWSDEKNAKKN